MKSTICHRFYVLMVGVFLISCNDMDQSIEGKTYPIAKKNPVTSIHHGVHLTDDYFWMRNRDSPEVLEYLNAENAFAEAELKDVASLRTKLFEEIKGRIVQTDTSAPYFYNGYMYYTRMEEGKEYPIYCRKLAGSDKEIILLDANEESKKHAFYQATGLSASPNNKILAYGEDVLSRRIYTIRFKNIETGEHLTDVLEGTIGLAVWANDNETIFYTRKDENTLRAFQVFKHKLGTPQSEDKLIFEESDDTFYTYVFPSKSRKYIFINSSSTLTSEYQFLDASDPDGEFKIVTPRQRGLEYNVEHVGEHFYIRNNGDGAKNFKISKVDVQKSHKSNWVDFVAHRDDFFIEDFDVFAHYMVLQERNNGLTRLHVIPYTNDAESHYIAFNDPTYLVNLSVNRDIDSDVLRYEYTSLTTPTSFYDYDLGSKELTLVKQQQVLGNFETENYISERIFAEGSDGTLIPISIVYRKDFVKDGSRPVLLYGYGSYGISIDAYFSSPRLSLLDRGFAFAIAHIRGGQEMGRHWYEDGKLLKKKNTFYDFIDCGKHLINENYTSSQHLYAMGGSAGGLLMGAVVNEAPQLWNGIVAQVPFVDVINTMLDETIPLTTGEYDEWGNPNEKEYFEYILSYSPYENVKPQHYPAILVMTGYHDSQVQYWEPAKWVAKLRDLKTDSNDLFFVTNMDAGHGGASGRFERYKEVALEYAFLLRQEGIKE